MTSRRLMGAGDSIMNSNNISNNISNSQNVSTFFEKSVNTNSTFVTPQRNNFRQINPRYILIKRDLYNNREKLIDSNYIPTPNNISKITSTNNSSLAKFNYNNTTTNRNNRLNKTKFNYNSNNYDEEKGLIYYIRTSPNKDTDKLMDDADKIMKERKNNHIMMSHLNKSALLKKKNEINLENYKIKLLINKRNEINDKLLNIDNRMKTSEKIFEQDYKRFIDFVESNNHAQKEQEASLNKIKKYADEIEKEYNIEYTKYKNFQTNIEQIIKKILLLKNYGSFVNYVFKNEFIYDKIPKVEGKNYLKLSDDIVKIYENYEEKKDSKNKESFNRLLENEYFLMAQFNEYEESLADLINEKEMLNNEINNIIKEEKDNIKKLKKKKNELEKNLNSINEEKNRFIKTMRTYNTPEFMEPLLDEMNKFAELLDVDNSSVLNKEKIADNYIFLCSDIIKKIKEKELIINDNIEKIEDIINSKNEDDRLLIEELISERKKEIKKGKLNEIIKKQNEEIRKKNMKAIERAQRIVVKGRKIDYDIPFFNKIKKQNKMVKTEYDDNDYDYLYYSSDDN